MRSSPSLTEPCRRPSPTATRAPPPTEPSLTASTKPTVHPVHEARRRSSTPKPRPAPAPVVVPGLARDLRFTTLAIPETRSG